MNLGSLLTTAARRWPERVALVEGEQRITYAELDGAVNQLAAGLRAQGLAPGDRVALVSWNHPQVLIAFWACFKAGLCVVPVNPRCAPAELAYVVVDCGARAVVHGPEFTQDLAPLAAMSGGPLLIEADNPAGWPAQPPAATASGRLTLGALAAGRDADEGQLLDVPEDHLAWLFYTSGTTGKPKGAMLTHANLRFVVVSWLADLELQDGEVALHSTPLSHAAGFHALAVAASGGTNVILHSTRFDTGLMLRVLEAERVTNIHLVPTQVKMLLADPAFDATDLSALDTVLYGAAPYPLHDLKVAIGRFGPRRLVQLYAQGETPMTATYLPREEHVLEGEDVDSRLRSCGYPRTGMELRVVDAEDRDVPLSEVGEVVVRGPAVMRGYWERPEATAEALRAGWLHTGDLGSLDARGRLHLSDRMKDVINSGGSNIYATEIEQVLLAHPQVAAAAVVGVPDERWGEAVAAVLVAEDRALDLADVERHCREQMGSYKVPKRWEVVDALPLNAIGKVLKRELRARLAGGPLGLR
jgi:long-chain acyl-CoA synthetase